jgi:hypothetical protein
MKALSCLFLASIFIVSEEASLSALRLECIQLRTISKLGLWQGWHKEVYNIINNFSIA